MLSKQKMLKLLQMLGITLIILNFVGCVSRQIILHPIEKSDIITNIENGSKIQHKDGKVENIEKDGTFVSDLYMERIMKVKIENK